MALPLTITGISTAVAPAGPFRSSAGGYYFFGRDSTTATTLQAYQSGKTVAQVSIVPANSASTPAFGLPGFEKRAQSFLWPATGTTLTSIGVKLRYNGSPTDSVQIDIYATDASLFPTGSSLGSVQIAASLLTTSDVIYDLVFPTPISLTGNVRYAMVMGRTGALDSVNDYVSANTGNDVVPTEKSSRLDSGVWGVSFAADFYLVAKGPNTPDVAWTSSATKTGFTTAILSLTAYQSGNVIHLLVMDGTASTLAATKYISYDMATDTFLATIETVAIAQALTGQAASGWGQSLVVRSDGKVVAFYNGLQTKTSGTFRARVYYRIRTGVNTWGTETSVDGGLAATDATSPVAVLGAADRVHFACNFGATVGYRTLSGANALNTFASSASMTSVIDGVGYDRSGTFKIVFTNSGTGQSTMYFNSADNPTPSFANHSITAADNPHRIGVDGTDVTIVYRNSTDSDLYAIKSTNDGASFGSPVSFFVGTVASSDANLSRNPSGAVFSRGADVVLPYVVNDNGTLKYNESIVRSTGVTGTLGRTEDPDVAASTGLVGLIGTLAKAEDPDVANAAGTVADPSITGTLGKVEDPDILAGTGSVTWLAALAAAEDADVAASTGTVAWRGTLAAVETADAAAGTGTVEWLAALAAAEVADTAALTGAGIASATGTLAATEAADVAALTGALAGLATGTLAASEVADVAAIDGGIVATGALAAAELPDTAAVAGLVADAGAVLGALAASEAADSAALGGEVAGEVVQPPIYGGGAWLPPRPVPVEGVGYGILPALEGEAHGVVVAASTGAAMLRGLAGEAAGAAGAGGQGNGPLTVKAAASGARGAKGAAVAVLGLEVVGAGSAGVRGKGCGVIGALEAVAAGRQDDDESAAVAWLLAA